MDNNMEQWERECEAIARTNEYDETERELIEAELLYEAGFRNAYLRQQARIDKLRAVLQELRDCAAYWSEYDVPVGIVERMDAVLADHIGDTNKKEPTNVQQ